MDRKEKVVPFQNLGWRKRLFIILLAAGILLLGVLSILNNQDKRIYEYEVQDNKITITKYKGNSRKVTVPSEIDGIKVTAIDLEAFSSNDNLREVIIQDGVEYIDDAVFAYAGNLQKVKLPASLTGIGRHAFYHCEKLEGIELPENLKTIGKAAFAFTNLKAITIPGSVEYIDHLAFYRCDNLKEAILEEGVQEIGDVAFLECTSLENVSIPGTVTGVFAGSFYNTPWLNSMKDDFVIAGDGILLRYHGSSQEVVIPDNVKMIGAQSFGTMGENVIEYEKSKTLDYEEDSSYTKIRKVVLHEGITSIGNGAFSGCTGLEEINLPDTITEIRNSSFADCISLQKIDIPAGVVKIGASAFYRCKSLERVILPENLSIIGFSAFEKCRQLDNIIIPEKVTEIRGNAFAGCSNLHTVEIPETVKDIASDAFSGTPWYENSTDEF